MGELAYYFTVYFVPDRLDFSPMGANSPRWEKEAPTILHKNSKTASIFCPFPRQSNVVGVMGGLFGVKMIIWKQHCYVGGGA